MQLKRLEISGFKSFRDKVVFDFSSGVSAIVGPNGCGKSNVVDALRWVMGEQRVKALRGKKMDDIIFHGSQDAAPIGVAEVVMVLTCAKGHTFPGLYANCTEVTVSRRLFRDGDSEYALNQIPCRLLDVKEFFLGTGVGARTYSLVEQNSVAGLVEAKPEERRQFIEEAAGVSKYRSRKEAAVRKMEATKQNLLRLNDVLREVKSQLNALARQAKRAEQYRNLKAAIREGEVTLSLRAYLGLHAQKTSLEEQKQSLEERIADEERLLQSFETAAEAVRMELLEQEALRSRLQEELYSVKNRIHLKEQAIEFSRNKTADLQNRQARHQVQMEEDQSRLDAIRKEQGRLARAASALEEEIGGARTAISDAEGNSEALRAEERTVQQRLETQKARLIDLAAEKAKLRNSAANLTRGLEDLRRRIEKEERERSESGQRLEALSGQAVALQRSLEDDEEILENLANRGMTAEDEEERIRTELGETEEQIAALKESLSAKTSRLQSLREFQEGYGWCSDATKALMTAPSDQCQSRGQFVGLVADCLSVSPAYEAAVEAVLGEKLQYIVVKSHEDGIQAIDYLKSCTLGRSSFVPVALRSGKSAEGPWDHLRAAVPLIEHVQVEENYRAIAEYLLGDVLLIPDLRTGLSLWSQNGFRGTFVTPDGDTISPHGVLTGGSRGSGERSLLKNKREIRELEEEMDGLSGELQEATEDRRRLVSLAQQWKEELAAVTAERHRTELRLNGRRKDAERLEDERRRLQQTLRTLDFNRENLLREESACRENLKETQERVALQEAHEKDMNGAIGMLQAQWLRVRQEREGRERLVTDARVRLAALEEKQRSLQKETSSLQAEGGQLQRRMEEAAGDDETVSRQMEELARSLEEDAAILTAAYQSLNEVDDTLNRKKDQQQALEATLREWEGKIRQVRRQGDDLADQVDRIEGDLRETVYGMDNLCRSLDEKHGLDLAAEARTREDRSFSDEDLKAREEQLRKDRQAVEAFGEVNLLAISEHDQLKERHDFLTAQAADLNGSLGALQRTIARINRISRERFAETFEAVSRCFQDVFARMFPGGKGALRLTDESDLLETGVEIEIQIPGKKLQNISLLSGGEKSLAALALILAIILYRPTPFLVLDEVDAALDDANVRLFANLVQEIAADSQVIMVTHNKSSMEAATNLYGVTMQKKGISTAVSVSLN